MNKEELFNTISDFLEEDEDSTHTAVTVASSLLSMVIDKDILSEMQLETSNCKISVVRSFEGIEDKEKTTNTGEKYH